MYNYYLERMTENVRRGSADLSVPLEHQLPLLGFNEILPQLIGRKTFDIGCGRTGELVEFLRGEGVEAYGIDAKAPDEPYFVRRNICGIGEKEGIPSGDRSVYSITAFQVGTLNLAFSSSYPTTSKEDDFTRVSRGNAMYIISEIGRTLQKGGIAVVYPYLDMLKEKAAQLLRMDGLELEIQPVENLQAVAEYVEWENTRVKVLSTSPSPDQLANSNFGRRIVLTKN